MLFRLTGVARWLADYPLHIAHCEALPNPEFKGSKRKMVAVLLGFCEAPCNDEIALQHFFFLLAAAQEIFFYFTCAACNFFFRKALAGIFFRNHPPHPQALNGRPLIKLRLV